MRKILNLIVKMKDDYYDCYDVMIVTLCDYFGVDGNRAFCWRWGFNYSKQSGNKMISLYDNMYVNRNHDTVCKLMEKYLGLELHGYYYKDIEGFDDFVKKKLEEGIPVGIVTDTMNCPWNPLYEKQTIKHCTLIIGYDEDNYYLKEPYFSEKTIIIEKRLFDQKLVKSILDIYFRQPEGYDFWKMIQEGFSYVDCDNNKYESMMLYASDLREVIEVDLQDDLSKYDVRYIPSLRSIKNLGSERKGLLKLFRDYSDVVPFSIIQLLTDCTEKWQICLTRLIRVYLTQKTNRLESISSLMLEIAEIEKEIYEETMNHILDICCEG